jgi:hypothetical protein
MRNNGAAQIAITTMQTGSTVITNVTLSRIILAEFWGNRWIATTPWGKYVLQKVRITVSVGTTVTTICR